MDYFPAINSILSPEHLANYLMAQYGLSKHVQCSVIRQGVNHTYKVVDGTSQFALRVYCHNWRSKEEIQAELDLLNLLQKQQIGVSGPIGDKGGHYIQELPALEGNRYAVLFSFAQGKSIRNPDLNVCHQLGVEMARMHQLTENKKARRKEYNAESLVQWAFDQVGHRVPLDAEPMQYFQRASHLITKEFEQADSGQLRLGIVHLDLWYDNMKITDDGQVTFFDFDNCGNSWLFVDLAYCLMLLFKNEPDRTQFELKKKTLIDGYESICGISDEENRLLPYGAAAIWLHYAGVQASRFDDFANPFFSEAFLQHWMKMTDVWMKYHGIVV